MTKNFGLYTTYSGQQVTIRLIQKEDVPLLVEMFNRLSPESKRLRFHLYTTRVPEEVILREATAISATDADCRVAIVATVSEEDDREHAVGVAQFVRSQPTDTEAEVAVVVRDDFQRKGLGKELLRVLARHARSLGITHFTAWIMTYNIRLMKLIKSMEELKDIESESRHGETKIRVPL